MMRDRRTFCEVIHSKEDIQIFALSQKGTSTSRMTNVFFGYGGSLLCLAGRRLKMWLRSKLCKEIFDICLPVNLLSSGSQPGSAFNLAIRISGSCDNQGQRYFALRHLSIFTCPTRASLAQSVFLFQWLLHLNNKNNVYNQKYRCCKRRLTCTVLNVLFHSSSLNCTIHCFKEQGHCYVTIPIVFPANHKQSFKQVQNAP